MHSTPQDFAALVVIQTREDDIWFKNNPVLFGLLLSIRQFLKVESSL